MSTFDAEHTFKSPAWDLPLPDGHSGGVFERQLYLDLAEVPGAHRVTMQCHTHLLLAASRCARGHPGPTNSGCAGCAGRQPSGGKGGSGRTCTLSLRPPPRGTRRWQRSVRHRTHPYSVVAYDFASLIAASQLLLNYSTFSSAAAHLGCATLVHDPHCGFYFCTLARLDAWFRRPTKAGG